MKPESTRRGGGFLLAITKDIRADEIELEIDDLEILAAKLSC